MITKRQKLATALLLSIMGSGAWGCQPVLAADVVGQIKEIAVTPLDSPDADGGWAQGQDNARNNRLTVSGEAQLRFGRGAMAEAGAASGNWLVIKDEAAVSVAQAAYVNGTMNKKNVQAYDNHLVITDKGRLGGTYLGEVSVGFGAQVQRGSTAGNWVSYNSMAGQRGIRLFGGSTQQGNAGQLEGENGLPFGGNIVETSGNAVFRKIVGGYTDDGNAVNNKVTIGGAEASYVEVYGGESRFGDVRKNTVTVNGGTMQDCPRWSDGEVRVVARRVAGPVAHGFHVLPSDELGYYGRSHMAHCIAAGYTHSGTAEDNLLVINAGNEVRGFGGFSNRGDAKKNRVLVNGGNITKTVVGGYTVEGDAIANQVTVAGGKLKANLAGGISEDGDAANNSIDFQKGDFTGSMLGGNALLGDAYNNRVTVADMKVSGSSSQVVGGMATGSAYKNNVVITGGTLPTVFGGYSGGDAVSNTITITGGQLQGGVAGGLSRLGEAQNNTINILGGHFGSEDTTEEANNVIAGGVAASKGASGNTVNIYGGTFGPHIQLQGGQSEVESQANTLNLHTKGNTIEGLKYFQNLNFYIPAGTQAGETMLTVTGTADVHGASIRAGVQDAARLNPGEVIKLLYSPQPLAADGASYNTLSGMDRVTDDAFVSRKAVVKKQDANTIVLTVSGDGGTSLDPDTKLIPEGRENALNTLVRGSDIAATEGYASAVAAYEAAWLEDHSIKAKFTPYVVLGGHNLRYTTGSYVDSHGFNGELGFVKRDYAKGHVDTIMPFAEYGTGSFTSHLDSGARGDGSQHYVGGGLLMRRDLDNGVHYEGMVRAGHLGGDYQGTIAGVPASWKDGGTYLAAHLGLGRKVVRKENTYDFYGKFFWTHLGSGETTLHTAKRRLPYQLDSVESYRTRLGARWTRQQNAASSIYAGLGWDYEFDGKARAAYKSYSTPSPTLQGSSGFVELGWQSKASKENPWGADVRVTGWAGRQRGVTYSATISRRI
ncbi:hypothetical protein DW089_08330 [Acidaminococcus sp. AM05-11]|uniref:hypothetical protein n=1 Tax=Acidaminococcus sp. AM05-11 TaxID=2291997 RepID=UPI000E5267FD|nr:hypothetical protein [Acidaminococcus sp. AM05-11]RHK01061.1 hypothetical protein DW089_08330 [Acidaminococcus sp. AM05-11]